MGLKKFSKEVVKEAKRVRWPKADTLIPAIIVVIVISFVTGLILFGEDALGSELIKILTNNAK